MDKPGRGNRSERRGHRPRLTDEERTYKIGITISKASKDWLSKHGNRSAAIEALIKERMERDGLLPRQH